MKDRISESEMAFLMGKFLPMEQSIKSFGGIKKI
jgi:hypothetical protein